MKKKIVTIILIFIIFCGFLFAIFKNNDGKKSFSIVMAGDAMITNSILNDAYDSNSGVYKFGKMLKNVREYVNKYDLAFYNQETPISGFSLKYYGDLCYNTPSSFPIDMMNIGFNIVNLANNHVLDGQYVSNTSCIKNEEGVINNINFWNKYSEIVSIGINSSQAIRDDIMINEKNGIKYAFLSYTYGTNMDKLIDYQPYLVNLYSDEQAKKDIEKIKDKVDVIFVSMHWGEENSSVPTDEQKRQANYLASLGVDVIVGTHPHVVQPIEWIDNTLVIYSLGNFIASQTNNYDYSRLVGMMLSFDVIKTNKKTKINNVNCELIYIYYDENKSNFLVTPFSYIDVNNSLYVRLYEKYSKIVRLYDDININQIGKKKISFDIE